MVHAQTHQHKQTSSASSSMSRENSATGGCRLNGFSYSHNLIHLFIILCYYWCRFAAFVWRGTWTTMSYASCPAPTSSTLSVSIDGWLSMLFAPSASPRLRLPQALQHFSRAPAVVPIIGGRGMVRMRESECSSTGFGFRFISSGYGTGFYVLACWVWMYENIIMGGSVSTLMFSFLLFCSCNILFILVSLIQKPECCIKLGIHLQNKPFILLVLVSRRCHGKVASNRRGFKFLLGVQEIFWISFLWCSYRVCEHFIIINSWKFGFFFFRNLQL